MNTHSKRKIKTTTGGILSGALSALLLFVALLAGATIGSGANSANAAETNTPNHLRSETVGIELEYRGQTSEDSEFPTAIYYDVHLLRAKASDYLATLTCNLLDVNNEPIYAGGYDGVLQYWDIDQWSSVDDDTEAACNDFDADELAKHVRQLRFIPSKKFSPSKYFYLWIAPFASSDQVYTALVSLNTLNAPVEFKTYWEAMYACYEANEGNEDVCEYSALV